MEITEIRFHRPSFRDDDHLQAYVDLVIDGELKIEDLRIIKGRTRTFVAFPTRPALRMCPQCDRSFARRYSWCPFCGHKTGQMLGSAFFRDVVAPICQAARTRFEDRILSAWQKHVEKGKSGETGKSG